MIRRNPSLSVVIIRDGEQLYWKTHELADSDATGDESESIHLTPPTYTGGQGNYTIGVRMEGAGKSAILDVREMAESAPDEDGCYFVLASLTEDGPVFGRGTSDEHTNCTG